MRNYTSSKIGHVRYINILAWLRGFRVKIANFSSFFCLSIPKRDLDTKKATPNIEFWPESLGAMWEYWYIERGLLHFLQVSSKKCLYRKKWIFSAVVVLLNRATTARHNYSRWRRPGNLKTKTSVFVIYLFQIQSPSFGKTGIKVYCKNYVLWFKIIFLFKWRFPLNAGWLLEARKC